MEVRIASDQHRVGSLAAATIARWLAAGGSLGLAGGSTPRHAYQELLNQPVNWNGVKLWMSDERWVPLEHEHSNTAMAHSALADHVAAELLEVPEVGEGDPETAAAHYDATLGRSIGDAPDVVMLGIGSDGHTASLFPGTAALAEQVRRYVANWVESVDAWRLTATVPYLCAASHIAFVVTGDAKADVVAEIMKGGSSLPAAIVADGANDVTWFLDEGAASRL
jgi:6-phosphogluconolactonase